MVSLIRRGMTAWMRRGVKGLQEKQSGFQQNEKRDSDRSSETSRVIMRQSNYPEQ
jgi:hypothetical protein